MARPTTTSLGHALGTRAAGTPISPPLTGSREIVCVGDSLTRGYLPDGTLGSAGYRGEIVSRIADAGYPWTLIGQYTDGGSAHEGVNGRTTGVLNGNLTSLFGVGNPYHGADAVILITGTNDCLDSGYDGPTAMYYLANILSELASREPQARVVVASSLPTVIGSYGVHAVNVADWNSRVSATLDASAIAAAGRLVRVPLGSAIRDAHVAGDGVHPDVSGYGLMASVIWGPLQNALGFDAEW